MLAVYRMKKPHSVFFLENVHRLPYLLQYYFKSKTFVRLSSGLFKTEHNIIKIVMRVHMIRRNEL